MKKLISLSLITSMIISNTSAGVIENIKEQANNTLISMHIKNKHLEELDFSTLYPKAIYSKSYFGYSVLAASIAASIGFSYITAGAGAPAAATGVSSVATWIGGNGVGAYMSGLSTVGSFFGGNAVLGGAILNGMSTAIIGGTAAKATTSVGGLLLKASIVTNTTASSLDGVYYFINPDNNNPEYKIKVTLPKDIGSKKIRLLVDEIYNIEDEILDANDVSKFKEFQKKEYIDKIMKNDMLLKHLSDESFEKALKEIENNDVNIEEHNKYIQTFINKKQDLVKKFYSIYDFDKKLSLEDLLIISIISWNNGNIDYFNKALNDIPNKDLKNKSFLNYLYALQQVVNGNINKAYTFLDEAIAESPYAIEPVFLYLNLLGNDNFIKNEPKILMLVNNIEKEFDSDKYASIYNLLAIYYRIGTFYFLNERYINAVKYYEKAYMELGFIQKYISSANEIENKIKLSLINAMYKKGDETKAVELFYKMLEDIKDSKKRDEMLSIFIGHKNENN